MSGFNNEEKLVFSFVAGTTANASIAVNPKTVTWTISDGSTDFSVGDTFTFYLSKNTPAASTPAAGSANIGNGTCSAPTVVGNCPEETITCTCTAAATNSGTFKVVGSKSGKHDDLTVGSSYTLTYQSIAVGDRIRSVLYHLTAGGAVTDKTDKTKVYAAGYIRCSDDTSNGSLAVVWEDRNAG